MAEGYGSLPSALAALLPKGAIKTNHHTVAISSSGDGSNTIAVEYSSSSSSSGAEVDAAADAGGTGAKGAIVQARRVVVAVPPGIAATKISFAPALPAAKAKLMASTQTWCSDWCKVIATFRTNFWSKKGDSGVCRTPGW